MSKKEMGIAVKALADYADDCFSWEDYVEMTKAFKVAISMASTYELREENWLDNMYNSYLSEVFDELNSKITEGRESQNVLDELKGEIKEGKKYRKP